MSSQNSCWYVYIVECVNTYLYTGITTDLKRRFEEHSAGKKGAKFFNRSKPKAIVFSQKVATRSEALKLELKIKRSTRMQKKTLIASALNQLNSPIEQS
jgi:putative endonuclease